MPVALSKYTVYLIALVTELQLSATLQAELVAVKSDGDDRGA